MRLPKFLRRDYLLLRRHLLFDSDYYLSKNPDVQQAGIDPILHYLSAGALESRDPHPLFSSSFYLAHSQDVRDLNINPLVHFIKFGAAEGRKPHVLFDPKFYLQHNQDVKQSQINPLVHYLLYGGGEGRKPHLLFDSQFYLTKYPEIKEKNINPLLHYIEEGGFLGYQPHPLFDSNYYLMTCPDVAACRGNPLVHFLGGGYREGRKPNALFSPLYYLKENPGIEATGLTPLEHFVAMGAQHLRWPSELFDMGYYSQRYQEELKGWSDPLSHFLAVGLKENYWPNELFSVDYYLTNYHDVAQAGVNPLEHYTSNGVNEGRRPNPYFDTIFYAHGNPDVMMAGMHPLAHYLRGGAKEFRAPSADFNPYYYWMMYEDVRNSDLTPLGHFLHIGEKEGRKPSSHFNWKASSFAKPLSELDLPHGNKVIVVIPVYAGYEITKNCIQSALKAKNNCPHEFLIIYDCGPEDRLRDYIQSLEGRDRVNLKFNVQNLGFVKSANLGMMYDPACDVILLNSDTLVNDYWLDRLYLQAYSRPQVGSVTPFSNNATICSYPTMSGSPHLFDGESLEFIDSVCANVNAGLNLPIPTAVGFCMYIPRRCLDRVGIFDEENFGKGYGEENDFCMRATAKGFVHLFALDTFVFHAGNVSFGDSSDARKVEAGRTILRLYPHYDSLVQSFCMADIAKPARNAITAGRYKYSSKQVCLIVTHALGGGTEKHISDLVSYFEKQMDFIFLRPIAEHGRGLFVRLSTQRDYDNYSEDFHVVNDFEKLLSALECFGVSRVHIHHTMGFQFSLRKLVRKMGLPFDFTVHDYFSVCPFVTLTDAKGGYCGEPNEVHCNNCVASRIKDHPLDILNWRERSRWLFEEAERVLAPSRDVAERVSNYYPEARVIEVPHDLLTGGVKVSDIVLPKLSHDEPLRVLMIGAMVTHKGSHLVRATMEKAHDQSFPLEFQLIGGWDENEEPPQSLKTTGAYKESEFSTLLDSYAPHLVWFPGQCPETYSYTLTLALEKGLPIVAPDIGSFRHRVKNRDWTWFLEVNPNPESVAVFFEGLRVKYFVERASFDKASRAFSQKAIPDFENSFYDKVYPEPLPPRKVIDLRRRGRVTGSIVCESNRDPVHPVPTACGYIRLVLPYTQTLMDIRMHTFIVPTDLMSCYVTDFMVTQRLALGNPSQVNSNLNHLKKYGIKMIYDLDDDLLGIDQSHPEYDHYSKLLPSVARQALEADLITVSTENLAKKMRVFNPHVEVILNSHDDRIWDLRHSRVSLNGKIRILYMGTPTHTEDLMLIKKTLEKILVEFKDQVEVVVVGGTNRMDLLENFKVIKVPDAAACSYPMFVKWLSQQGPFHIGLSPLVENRFNIGKSALKYMDYTALGLVTICSEVSAYANVVTHDVNGLMVPNNPEAWENALRELLTNREKLSALQENARNDYLMNHIFNTDDSKPAQAIEKVIRHLSSHSKPLSITRSIATHGQEGPSQHECILAQVVEGSYSPGLVFKVGSTDGLSADNLMSSIRFDQMLRLSSDESLRAYNVKTLIVENLFLENENPIQVFMDLFAATSFEDFVILKNPINYQKGFDWIPETDLQHLIRDYTLGPAVSRWEHYLHWLKQKDQKAAGDDKEAFLELYESGEVQYYHRVSQNIMPEFFSFCQSVGLKFEVKVHLTSKKGDLFVLQKEQSRIEISKHSAEQELLQGKV